MSTLGTILKDNWEWRGQIFQLAVFDLKKQIRGAVLGWAWFVIKPAVYIACFWFGIKIGLRAGHVAPGAAPYILWLSAGIIPWFFMKDMLSGGIDVMHRYPYLVTKVKFPIGGIPTIYVLSSLAVQLLMMVLLLILYFACGQPLDIHLVQVPVLLAVMCAFWWLFSMFMSPLCAISKDIKNLMGALSTPFFWLSGVIFNVRDVPVDWIQAALYFNPITALVTGFRDAFYERVWVWEDPTICVCFGVVFAVTLAVAVIVYKKTSEKVADVL